MYLVRRDTVNAPFSLKEPRATVHEFSGVWKRLRNVQYTAVKVNTCNTFIGTHEK